MKKVLAICLFAVVGLTAMMACDDDQQWSDIICKDGYALLVPTDDHSGKSFTDRSKYVCGKVLPNLSEKYAQRAGNGFFTIDNFHDISYKWGSVESGHSCGFFHSMNSCHYKDCPDCKVVYCSDRNQLTISDVSCYDYYIDKENDNTFFGGNDQK